MKCKKCGAEFSEGLFCPECGEKYIQEANNKKKCKKCGTEFSEGAFCPGCGEPYTEQTQSARAGKVNKKAITTQTSESGKKKKKSKLPLIIGIVAVILVALVFLVMASGSSDSSSSGTDVSEYLPKGKDDVMKLISRAGLNEEAPGFYTGDDLRITLDDSGFIDTMTLKTSKYSLYGIKVGDEYSYDHFFGVLSDHSYVSMGEDESNSVWGITNGDQDRVIHFQLYSGKIDTIMFMRHGAYEQLEMNQMAYEMEALESETVLEETANLNEQYSQNINNNVLETEGYEEAPEDSIREPADSRVYINGWEEGTYKSDDNQTIVITSVGEDGLLVDLSIVDEKGNHFDYKERLFEYYSNGDPAADIALWDNGVNEPLMLEIIEGSVNLFGYVQGQEVFGEFYLFSNAGSYSDIIHSNQTTNNNSPANGTAAKNTDIYGVYSQEFNRRIVYADFGYETATDYDYLNLLIRSVTDEVSDETAYYQLYTDDGQNWYGVDSKCHVYFSREDEINIDIPNDGWTLYKQPQGTQMPSVYVADYSASDSYQPGKIINPDYMNDPGSYLCSWSDSEYMTEDQLQQLDYYGARLVKNEIYARHGRMFNDSELQAFFNEKTWYYGTISPNDFDDAVFNEYEKTNLKLIESYMEKHAS